MKITGNNIFKALRIFFGLFMIVVYLGMAVLMLMNFFNWGESMTWFRYVLAVVFFAYGIYRCYRQVAGIDYYRMGVPKDEDEEDKNN